MTDSTNWLKKHGDLLRPPAVNHILVRLWQEEQLFALADSFAS
jgi:hypothetical protein